MSSISGGHRGRSKDKEHGCRWWWGGLSLNAWCLDLHSSVGDEEVFLKGKVEGLDPCMPSWTLCV